MKILKRQITMTETDAVALIVVGGLCLLIALILPHPTRRWWLLALGVINIFNGWRLRRKISAAKDSQSHSDS
jgi:hypothetical protein